MTGLDVLFAVVAGLMCGGMVALAGFLEIRYRLRGARARASPGQQPDLIECAATESVSWMYLAIIAAAVFAGGTLLLEVMGLPLWLLVVPVVLLLAGVPGRIGVWSMRRLVRRGVDVDLYFSAGRSDG